MTLSLKERMAQLKQKKEMEASPSTPSVATQLPATTTPISPADFPATPLGELQTKLHELREMLLTDHPQIPRLLQIIHKVMAEQGDLVIQLSDEEIAVFIQGLKNHMNVTVVAEKTKKATSSAALKKASAAELSGGMDQLAALAASLGVTM